MGLERTNSSLKSARNGNFLRKQARSLSLMVVATAPGSGMFLLLDDSSLKMSLAADELEVKSSASMAAGSPELQVQNGCNLVENGSLFVQL